MTVSGSFSVEVNLQIPPQPFTVTYDANGGYFGEDTSSTLNQVTYIKSDKAHITKIAKTDNVGEDGAQTYGSYGNNVAKNQVITIPGAENLKVTVTYQTESTNYDWVCLYEGLDITPAQGNYNQSKSGKLGGTTKTTKEFTIQGDTVQIFFRSDSSSSDYYGFYAVVEAEAQKTEIIAGEEKQPDHAAKKFVGWYTDAACSDGNEFTLKDCTENAIVYAKWKDPTAVLLNAGSNTGLSKKFADIAETPKTITAFQRSAVMPDASVMDETHCISAEGSEVPVYLWKDGTILKWWSKAIRPEVQSLMHLYNGYSNLTDISGISDWNTSNVTEMGRMFYGCNNLTDLTPLSGWNTSNVTEMGFMFSSCNSLTDLTALSDWNTSKVINMGYMFQSCSSLTSLIGLSNWDTGSVVKMSGMFSDCSNLTDLSLNALQSWETGNVTNMSSMFSGCSNLHDINVLANWNTAKVTDMSNMFMNCKNLDDLNALTSWDTTNVKDMSYMFCGLNKIKHVETLESWDTTNVKNMSGMFSFCSLTDVSALANWKTENVENMSWMFNNCDLTDVNALGSWKTGTATNMSFMFYACDLTDVSTLTKWDTGRVENMSNMFNGCDFTDLSGLETWNTGRVTNMSSMFSYCYKLTDASAINDWDILKVTNFESMFIGCSSHPTFTKRAGTWDSNGTFTPTS